MCFLFFLAATRTCALHLRPSTTLVAISIRLAMPTRNRMSRWRDTWKEGRSDMLVFWEILFVLFWLPVASMAGGKTLFQIRSSRDDLCALILMASSGVNNSRRHGEKAGDTIQNCAFGCLGSVSNWCNKCGYLLLSVVGRNILLCYSVRSQLFRRVVPYRRVVLEYGMVW